jgi:hypothetical protein
MRLPALAALRRDREHLISYSWGGGGQGDRGSGGRRDSAYVLGGGWPGAKHGSISSTLFFSPYGM